jgi:uncharacterized protein (TIGR02996 family)
MSFLTDGGAALLAAILDDPADDARRLVYADYLEENGEYARAESIRVGVELARVLEPVESHWPAGGVPDGLPRRERQLHLCRGCWGLRGGRRVCRYHTLLWRAEDLLRENDNGARWVLSAGGWPWEGRSRGFACMYSVWGWQDDTVGTARESFQRGLKVAYRRGFVAAVRCPLDLWVEHGKHLVRAQPVERVELTDRNPTPNSLGGLAAIGWRRHDPATLLGDLPAAVWGRLLPTDPSASQRGFEEYRWYDTEALARDDSSRALIRFAKEEEESA